MTNNFLRVFNKIQLIDIRTIRIRIHFSKKNNIVFKISMIMNYNSTKKVSIKVIKVTIKIKNSIITQHKSQILHLSPLNSKKKFNLTKSTKAKD